MKESRSCGSDEYPSNHLLGFCLTELLISNEGGLHDIALNPIEKIANTYPFIITRCSDNRRIQQNAGGSLHHAAGKK